MELWRVVKICEFVAEVGACAVDPGFDCAEAGAEGLGDFVVAEALLLEHEDGVALLVGERCECAVEGFFDFAGMVALFGLLLHDEVGGVDEVEWAA